MWEPRSLTAEERYQQLEDVAKRMLRFIESGKREAYMLSAYKYYRKQLEELVVNVDE